MLTRDEVKTILGIIGPTLDSAIDTLIPIVNSWFESACNRGLAFQADEHLTFESVSNVLHLYRFPIVTVYSATVNGMNVTNNFEINAKKGTLVAKTSFNCRYNNLTVVYDGGFQPVPADLAFAFASVIGDQIGESPASTSTGSGSTSGDAPLKSLSLGSGAIAVSFQNTSSTSSTGGLTGGYDVSQYPPELQNYASVLNRYRTEALPV